MVIIHKDTHYEISNSADRVVQDLHGWYHPKFVELCQQHNIKYELVEYEKYNTPDKKITDFKTEGHE